MRQFGWLLVGAAVAVLFMDWFHLRVAAASARGQVVRCVEDDNLKSAMVDSCISSLALCVDRDEGRETIFRAYMNAGARAQEREADQQRTDQQVLRARHARQ